MMYKFNIHLYYLSYTQCNTGYQDIIIYRYIGSGYVHLVDIIDLFEIFSYFTPIVSHILAVVLGSERYILKRSECICTCTTV